jgi:hypothetical protein
VCTDRYYILGSMSAMYLQYLTQSFPAVACFPSKSLTPRRNTHCSLFLLNVTSRTINRPEIVSPKDVGSAPVAGHMEEQEATKAEPVIQSTTAKAKEEVNNPPAIQGDPVQVGNGNTKIYSDRHKILGLSNEELNSIGVGTMMSWYGEASGGGSCSEDFGNALIRKWRQAQAPYCSNKAHDSTAIHSSVDCYLIHQTRHHGDGDNLCVMKNVGVRLGLFGDDDSTRPIVKRYVDTKHGDQPYIHFSTGFVQGDCKPEPEKWDRKYFPGWGEDWIYNSYEQVNDFFDGAGLRGGSAGKCDEWIDHPVIISQRDTFANFFHDSEDFINIFLSMAILDYKRGDTQIFNTDLYPKGPFWYGCIIFLLFVLYCVICICCLGIFGPSRIQDRIQLLMRGI